MTCCALRAEAPGEAGQGNVGRGKKGEGRKKRDLNFWPAGLGSLALNGKKSVNVSSLVIQKF